jgi:hypothetical protein
MLTNCYNLTTKNLLIRISQGWILLCSKCVCWSKWPRGLRRGSAAARLLGLRDRIPPEAWKSVVSVVCCQAEVCAKSWPLVQRSPTKCGVSECDRENSNMRSPWPSGGSRAMKRFVYVSATMRIAWGERLCHNYYYYYRYSALGPVWAETRAQSGDWCGSGTLHPGQILRGSLPLLSPRLDGPTFATRCLHVGHDARDPSGRRWNCGRECCPVILPKWRLPRRLGIFYMTQIYDMGPTALLPLWRKAWRGFFRP